MRSASGWGRGVRGLACDPSALLARPNLFPDLFTAEPSAARPIRV